MLPEALASWALHVHQVSLMTSWALVGDVWFLEPQKRLEGESAIDFAGRVQAMIAARAKLQIVPWDGCGQGMPCRAWLPTQSPLRACNLLSWRHCMYDTLAISQGTMCCSRARVEGGCPRRYLKYYNLEVRHPELVEKQRKAYAQRLRADFPGGGAALSEAAGKAAGDRSNGDAQTTGLRKR